MRTQTFREVTVTPTVTHLMPGPIKRQAQASNPSLSTPKPNLITSEMQAYINWVCHTPELTLQLSYMIKSSAEAFHRK